MTKTTVVIFGATGAVGTALAERLADSANFQIQAISRQADGSSRLAQRGLPNVSMVAGDPENKQNVFDLTKEADVIVSCIGFHKYQAHYWAKHWPLIVENLLAATVQPGRQRRLVFCDNLYAYGAGHDAAIHPLNTTTVAPSSRSKPAIRSQMRQMFNEHMRQHPGTLAVVGGADFFGDHVTNTSFLGDTVTGKIVQGQSTLAIGSASTVHDFCYVPDFSHALAIACTDDRALDRFWICPHAIHDKTMTEIATDIGRLAGQEKAPKMSVLPTFMVYLLSPFMDFMWEMIEMLPFWTKDYRVDDSDFIQTFGVQATPYEQALGEYVSFYQKNKAKAN